MAGWSTLSNGSSLDCVGIETVTAFNGNGCCLVEDQVQVDSADHDKLKQKCLFYQLFPDYLKENSCRGNVRPVPVLLGDGHLLDLYQLFSLVKERGGYAAVSRKGLWGSVTKDLGLSLRVLSSVKLVYDKYLNDFEGWVRKTFEEKNFKNGNHGGDRGFKSLPLDLEKEFRGLLCSNLKDKDDDFVQLESDKFMKYIDLVNHKSDASLSDTENQNNKCEDVQHVDGDGDHHDDDEKLCNGVKDDLSASVAEIAEKGFNSRKRKREALSGMLNWMKDVAKHPLDPLTQPIPKLSKFKEYKGQDVVVQVLRARDVLSLRQHVEPNSGPSSLQV